MMIHGLPCYNFANSSINYAMQFTIPADIIYNVFHIHVNVTLFWEMK